MIGFDACAERIGTELCEQCREIDEQRVPARDAEALQELTQDLAVPGAVARLRFEHEPGRRTGSAAQRVQVTCL